MNHTTKIELASYYRYMSLYENPSVYLQGCEICEGDTDTDENIQRIFSRCTACNQEVNSLDYLRTNTYLVPNRFHCSLCTQNFSNFIKRNINQGNDFDKILRQLRNREITYDQIINSQGDV